MGNEINAPLRLPDGRSLDELSQSEAVDALRQTISALHEIDEIFDRLEELFYRYDDPMRREALNILRRPSAHAPATNEPVQRAGRCRERGLAAEENGGRSTQTETLDTDRNGISRTGIRNAVDDGDAAIVR